MPTPHDDVPGKRSSELRALLNDWDPIGVLGGAELWPADEYDCLIDPLTLRLDRGDGADLLVRYLRHELEDHFGLDPDDQADKIERFAERAIRWRDHRRGR
jgi:hypothetical protein